MLYDQSSANGIRDRYALSTSLPSWADAEAQVLRKTKRPKFGKVPASDDEPLTVSIKSDRPKPAYKAEDGEREGKRKKHGVGEDGERKKKKKKHEKGGRAR